MSQPVSRVNTFVFRLLLLLFVLIWRTSSAWRSSNLLKIVSDGVRSRLWQLVFLYLRRLYSWETSHPLRNNRWKHDFEFSIRRVTSRRPEKARRLIRRAVSYSLTVPAKSVPLRKVNTEIIGWINVWRNTMTNVHVQQNAGIILTYLKRNVLQQWFVSFCFRTERSATWRMLDCRPTRNSLINIV